MRSASLGRYPDRTEYAFDSDVGYALQLPNPIPAPNDPLIHGVYTHSRTVKSFLFGSSGDRRPREIPLSLQSINLPPPCALRHEILVVSHFFSNNSPELVASRLQLFLPGHLANPGTSGFCLVRVTILPWGAPVVPCR